MNTPVCPSDIQPPFTRGPCATRLITCNLPQFLKKVFASWEFYAIIKVYDYALSNRQFFKSVDNNMKI